LPLSSIKADEYIFVEQVLGNIPEVTLTRVEVQALDKQEAIDAAERIIDEFEAVEATGRKLGEPTLLPDTRSRKSTDSLCQAHQSARRAQEDRCSVKIVLLY